MPHFLLTSVICPPTGILAVPDAGAMSTQDDLPRSESAIFWRALDLSYGALVSTRSAMSMVNASMRMMMSRSLSSERVFTFSSAMRRLPVGAGPVTVRAIAVEESVIRRRIVSGSGGAYGTGARSRT